MDILGAQKPQQRDRHHGHTPDTANGPVTDWIQMAIDIEEKQYVTMLIFLRSLMTSLLARINIQDRVHRLRKEPREDDRRHVEQLRDLLTGQYNAGQLEGTLEVKDYTLKKAPVLTKIFTIASLTGMPSSG